MEIRITNILNRFHCKFIPAKFIFRNGTKKKYAKYKAIPILGLINKNTIIDINIDNNNACIKIRNNYKVTEMLFLCYDLLIARV